MLVSKANTRANRRSAQAFGLLPAKTAAAAPHVVPSTPAFNATPEACRFSAKTRQRGWLGYPYPYRSRDWASSNSPFSFLTPTLVHRPLQRAFTCSGPEAVVDRSAGNSARLRAGRAALAEQELGPVEHCCPDHLGGAEIDDPLMLDA